MGEQRIVATGRVEGEFITAVYTRRDGIPRVRGGLGTAIISTPRGVMTGRQAYQQGLGGEVLCYVW